MPKSPRTDFRGRAPRPARTAHEPNERIYGAAAARATLQHRLEHVVNIAHTRAARGLLAPFLREAAKRKIAYREVHDDELARIAGSVHHEGVCLLVRERAEPSVAELARATEPAGLLLALDRVGNPHNAGAVLRSAAFFGARGLLLADPGRALVTPAALRIAEGGAEHVPIARVQALAPALAELRRLGMVCVGAAAHAGRALHELRWPERCVLVLGREHDGLSDAVQAQCDTLVHIRGAGALDSLNVSVAAGILLASYAAR